MWELGSLLNSNSLIEVPLRSHGMKNLAAVVVLDLSQPDRLWTELECALTGLKQAAMLYESSSETIDREVVRARVGLEHPDLNTLELFLFPVIIVGGKYDLFQNLGLYVFRLLHSPIFQSFLFSFLYRFFRSGN